MKIFLLADASSSHTIKWANSLAEAGLDVLVFTLVNYDGEKYSKNISILQMGIPYSTRSRSSSSFMKLSYLKPIFQLRKYLVQYKPDILHAHYASSYGLLGAMTGFHPFIVSVWGSDVYQFPNYSFIHRMVLIYVLFKADKILSTSYIMREETKKYTNKEIKVTPFGIEINRFRPQKISNIFEDYDLVIGTIKTLEKNYGIEYLIRAFKITKEKYPNLCLKLLIIGQGSQKGFLENLVKSLDIQSSTKFLGFISPSNIPDYHNMIDIFVAPSLEESFGVAVLEANACNKPVIVTNVGGLPEIVEDGKNGFVVEKENSEAISIAICKLIEDESLRKSIGKAGRLIVLEKYNWNDSVQIMLKIYYDITNKIQS